MINPKYLVPIQHRKSNHAIRRCFQAGYYYIVDEKLVLHFTEGEIYEYPEFSIVQWTELKNAVSHGADFNMEYRRPNRVAEIYERTEAIPTGYDDSFVN